MAHLSDGDKPLLLVFPHNVMAHYLRCIQLANYLSTHFRVKFLYSARYHSFVTQPGFETFECESLDAEKIQQCVVEFDFSWLNERDLTRIFNAQVKVINKLKADAVLGDTSPTLKMAAEHTGVFHLSLMNGYMSRHYMYVRRVPRSYPLYKLMNVLPKSLANYFTTMGEQISFHDIHRPFSKIRKRVALPVKYSYLQELEGNVNLICDLPELFPQKDLPANYYFIPPLFYPLTDDDDEILSRLDPAKKTLYVSMGSTGNWQDVAFLNNAGYSKYNIVTAGDRDKSIHGSTVISYPFINSSRLLNHVDLVICHGGNGTTYQALSYGIPVLCITSHFEQEYNVDGLERLKLGKSIDEIADNKNYLAIIEKWINKKGCKNFTSIKNIIAGTSETFSKRVGDMLETSFYKQQFVAHK